MLTAPKAQGLYDPQFEHDACGVGFIAHVKGQKSHALIRDALTALVNLNHRGACGCEAKGDDTAIRRPQPLVRNSGTNACIRLLPLAPR